jgi:hypothetical protein
MRFVLVFALALLVLPAHRAAAQGDGPIHAAIANAASDATLTTADDPQSPAPRHVAFEYSDGYKTRAKIHKYAAFATLPLFATEFALGQSLYNNPSNGKSGAHVAIGSGIIGLYAVQGVTGVWNLVEANKDPNPDGTKRRLTCSPPAPASRSRRCSRLATVTRSRWAPAAPARTAPSPTRRSASAPPGTS